MKLNVLALSALLALAVAETTSSDAATVTLSPEAKCANACSTTDSCCIAACYNVPCPSDSQANDTNTCVAACPQGNGSAEDSKKYGECEQACFSSHYFPAHGAAATETSSSGTTATGSMATETGSSSSSGFSQTGASSTSGSPSSSSTGAVQATNAAANLKLGASGAGLFGLVLAAFAL